MLQLYLGILNSTRLYYSQPLLYLALLHSTRLYYTLPCLCLVLLDSILLWMRVLLLFTGQLCFPRGTVCPYATSKSSQCGSHQCDIKTHRILYKTMLFVCVSCAVNECNVSSSFPVQMVSCRPLVENAAEEERE